MNPPEGRLAFLAETWNTQELERCAEEPSEASPKSVEDGKVNLRMALFR